MSRFASRSVLTVLGLLGIGLPAVRADVHDWTGDANAVWQDPGNWANNQTPGGGDVAMVALPDAITLFGDTASLSAFVLSQGAGLNTNGHRLLVDSGSGAEITVVGFNSILTAFLSAQPAVTADSIQLLNNGKLHFAGGVASASQWSSSGGWITGHGTIDVTGSDPDAFVNAGTIHPTGVITIVALDDADLDLDADGAGVLWPAAGATLRVAGSLDGQFGGAIEIDADGEIDFLEDWGSSTDAVLQLNDGFLRGAIYTHRGLLQGSGAVEVEKFKNFGTIEASGGVLKIIPTGPAYPNDLDNGVHRALEGDLELYFPASSTGGFEGTIEAANGHTFATPERGNNFQPGSFVDLDGGTLECNSVFFYGENETPQLHVRGVNTSTIRCVGYTVVETLVQIDGDLVVDSDLYVQDGADVTGSGRILHLDPEHDAKLFPGIEIGVDLTIGSRLYPIIGNTGELTLDEDLDLTSTARMVIDLAAAEEHDMLAVNGDLNIGAGATLEINLLDGYEPDPGASFVIATAGQITGSFADVPSGYAVTYESNEVRLAADGSTCTGDIVPSGTVDIEDLLLVLSAWGPVDDHPADTDGDNEVDITDLLAVLADWGTCP